MLRGCFQHLLQIERKRIAAPAYSVLRLNRGERVEPLPPELLGAMYEAVRGPAIQQYPDYTPFYTRLASFMGVPTSRLVVGAGIEEFIRTLMFICCDPGERVAVLWPTCAMYDIYAKAFGLELVRVNTLPGFCWSVDELIKTLSSYGNLRLLFIPNPGQPVETCYSVMELEQLANWAAGRDIVLAIDEAHYGFGAPTALELVSKYRNLLVLRTFSKMLGAAGLRVGFAVSQEFLATALHAVRPSGEITGPSLAMATVLLDNYDIMEFDAQRVAEGREYLRGEVIGFGLRAWGYYGFSVLIGFGDAYAPLVVAKALAEMGIHVKAGFPHPVDRCMLVACGYQSTMQTFFEALRDVVRAKQIG